MKKTWLGILLALCMVLGLLPFGAAASGFQDVPSDAYYAESVAWAVENDVTKGTSDTAFSPNATCTRAQVVTFLWRAARQPEPSATANPFKDVKADSYYGKAVLWAVEMGITAGTSKTTFSPDAGCTRAQVVTFLYRTAGEPETAASSRFSDVAKTAYYAEPVAWALENEVTSGTSATTFSPDATCTRAQIVTFLYRQQQIGEVYSLSKVTITKEDGTVTKEEYQYDDHGNNTVYQHHGAIMQKRTYDASGLPQEQIWTAGEDERTTRYEHDAQGRRIRETSTWNFSPDSSEVTTYEYDAQQRLACTTTVHGDQTIKYTYAYDKDGNLLTEISQVKYGESGKTDQTTHTYEYDDHGSMIRDTMVWDSETYDSKNTSVTEYVYTYGEDGEITACTELEDGEEVSKTTWSTTGPDAQEMTETTMIETQADGDTYTTVSLYDALGLLVRETFLNSEGKATLIREYEYVTLRTQHLPKFWQGVMEEEIYA